MRLFFLGLFLSTSFLSSCQHRAANTSAVSLRFINEFVIPNDMVFDSTTVGGLSGIDYDQANDVYYFITDDRSAVNPARFYKAKIYLTEKGIDNVRFLEVRFLLQPDGHRYPSSKQDKAKAPDPESIRFNAKTKQLVWTSEGERSTLNQPSINVISAEGKFIESFPLPKNLEVTSTENGSRNNGSLESISFANNFKTMFVANEEPLYEDGPRADAMKTKSWSRIFQFDVDSKKNTAQYAYPLDPVAYPSSPANAFKVNGVSEILSLSKNKLLTVERSFSTGRISCTIKVFETDISRADNIIHVPSLTIKEPAYPAVKKLVLNMDDLGIYIDNVEGVTFGPMLPNGNRTLIFVSDNNFHPFEKTQFLLFEVIEKK